MPKRQPKSASVFMSPGQYALLAITLVGVTALAVADPTSLLRLLMSTITIFYAVFVILKTYLYYMGARYVPPATETLPSADDPSLPLYTILAPLYEEGAVLPQLVQWVEGLWYPRHKLEVLILLDHETRRAAEKLSLPGYFKIVIVPSGGPQTKPRACNYGYLLSTGKFIVIYDAEDRMQPDQLLKAVAAFRRDESRRQHRKPLGCVQARLEFDNASDSLVSAFYWAEYVAHFSRTLLGLARAGLPIPLGGTSNHFLREALDAVAATRKPLSITNHGGFPVNVGGPWDPYNVTEDADLGFCLELAGYSVGMIDSVTFEAAPTRWRTAWKQRGRWLKGYKQTFLVHTREPLRTMTEAGPLRWFCFVLLMFGTPASLVLNPIVWGMTLSYMVVRIGSGVFIDPQAATTFATYVEGLIPTPLYYIGMVVAIVGNGNLFMQKLVTALRMEQYSLVKFLLLVPIWWATTSFSAYRALYEIINPRKRFHWAKTDHTPVTTDTQPILQEA